MDGETIHYGAMYPRHMVVAAFITIALNVAYADALTPPIAARMQEMVHAGEVPGVVTLVATRKGVTHLHATGSANAAGTRPLRPDSLFWIASMTKPVTGTAILMLQEAGKLSVNDLVSKYIPELASLKTPSGQPANLTLTHLMTHTSGMAEATSDEAKAARKLADLIPAYAAKPLQFEPGSTVSLESTLWGELSRWFRGNRTSTFSPSVSFSL